MSNIMRVPLEDLLFALSMALDCVEHQLLGVTSNHGKRTALLSMRLCRAMGLSEEDVFDMATCAVLHDNALTAYMLEAGPASDIYKLEAFKKHCPRGEENAQSFPFLGDASGIILHHHEKWDGTGYHGLVGNAIPLRASVLRMTDNLDLRLAMGGGQPGMEMLIAKHVRTFRGTHYAPVVVDTLLGLLDENLIRELSDEYIDASLAAAVPSAHIELNMVQLLDLCHVFAVIIDAKSSFTQRHSTGLAIKARRLAKFLEFDPDCLDKITAAAFLHDLGKLSTPAEILEKPGPLTHDEYEVMKDHVAMTWRILHHVRGLEDIVLWASSHHEKLDGHGYPHGLGADELTIECRIMACCDIYQALTEDRPYRPGMNHEAAMKILHKMAEEGKIDASLVAHMDTVMGDDTLWPEA